MIGERPDAGRGRSARSQIEGRQRYEARRPTNEQVQDFLGRDGRDGRTEQRAGDAIDRAQRRQGDVDQFRRDGDRAGQAAQRQRQLDQRDRDGRNDRDRDFAGRDSRDRDGRDRDFADRDSRPRDGRDRDFADRDGRDRDRDWDNNDGRNRYWQWRNQAWADGRGRGRDFRDWSGRWRDGNRFDVARQIRNRWRGRDWNDFPFRSGWWGGQNWYGRPWGFWDSYARNRPFYWWAWATAPRLNTWLTYNWASPYYWDYGRGEYIYYDDGAIYVNGRWFQPAPVYYNQTVRLIEQAPDYTAEEAAELEWLPLGVFAVTPEGQFEATYLVQLAVTEDGLLAGNATDQSTGAVYPVEGTVDQQSQRAVWSFTSEGGDRTVMETSIYNLTQPESTGLVHQGPNEMDVIELVRLEAPESTEVAVEGQVAPTTR
jgi:hypothetical protein